MLAGKLASAPKLVTGPWTDDELNMLAKLVAKYPGGVSDRWETIAGELNRKTAEVIKQVLRVAVYSIVDGPTGESVEAKLLSKAKWRSCNR